MIKDMRHAELVQSRRIDAGKRGYAKAVRRFLLRDHGLNYKALKPFLPVMWNK